MSYVTLLFVLGACALLVALAVLWHRAAARAGLPAWLRHGGAAVAVLGPLGLAAAGLVR